MENLVVTVVNTESTKVSDLLGISEERNEELSNILRDEMKNQDKGVTEIMTSLSEKAENANELAFLNFKFGYVLGQMKSDVDNPLLMLAKMLGGRG